SANASVELLKAHAVISRSWLLSQLQQKGKARKVQPAFVETETEHIRWYDREDHAHFDVCADDHCQRYQGITKASNPHVFDVIQATRGQVLCSGNEICDARFSKSCGGMMEGFQYCWENSPKPYLIGRPDRDCSQNKKDCKPNQHLTTLTGSSDKAASTADDTSTGFSDLRNEANAEAWILGHPESFCNTTDKKILSQVLNNYDQETTDFYRWQVFYSTETISKLIRERSGIDFGDIIDLIPVERGLSGRLVRLKIVGSKRTLIIGKELEIRRTLSPSHLYSSAFVVKKTPEGFTLHGAGWGHGVGLCQIGAAVMGEKGYTYQAILSHYYPNTIIRTLYQ
ncbi:MAG: SpoIID/LytB domain-containing protein, partial [Bacteroidota bacterium]|nr:SpoIID/LytB domain-containing protein [Bacteroidota bacterium]